MSHPLYNTALKFSSGRYKMRSGYMPLSVGLGLAYCFVVLWLIVSINMIPLNPPFGILIMCSTITFCFLVTAMSLSIVKDMQRSYSLEVNETEVVLDITERSGKSKPLMILLDDVIYAEYYSSSCVIFHTSYRDFEVPIWPLGARGVDFVDYLIGRGVQVINVEQDEPDDKDSSDNQIEFSR